MHKDVKPKKINEFSQCVAILLSILFTTYAKLTLENRFSDFQELPYLMDLGLYLIIFIPFHYIILKFTDWLYSGNSVNNS